MTLSLWLCKFFSDLKDTDIPVCFSIASTDRAGLTWAEERAAEGVDVVRQERGGSAKLKKCQHLQKKHLDSSHPPSHVAAISRYDGKLAEHLEK